jgi:hypothetical protein
MEDMIEQRQSVKIGEILRLCKEDSIRWTDHAIMRMIQRGISRIDVKHTLINGKIIEQYPDDYPYPSCLILGGIRENRHLHVICGIGSGELWIISAYYPNPEKWLEGFEKRKGS